MMEQRALSPTLWQDRPGFRSLLATIGADEGAARLVGGCVRDLLLGESAVDFDIATRLLPPEVMTRLTQAGIKAIPTGLQHGTVTAVTYGVAYEITTLRRDVETFGRHATVAFTDDWREDAARRDFTINALYADPHTGEIYDYFNGCVDLAAQIVRFIGDPLQRIAEDHLRILRFFRFSARFSENWEPCGLAACAERAADLMALSRERIRDELLKLLALPRPAATITTMIDHGILSVILPEIARPAVERLVGVISAETQAAVPASPVRRLASLLPPDAEVADSIARRLRLSNADRRRLVAAATPAPVPADPRVLAYHIGGEATLDRLLITQDPRTEQWAATLANWRRPRMPLTGKDIIAMGVPPGPEVSRLLHEIETRWLAAGLPANTSHTAKIARDVVGVK